MTVLDNSLITRSAASVKVSYRTNWTGDWTEAPYAYCDSLTLTANPGISAAALSMRFGRIIQSDESDIQTVTPLDLANKFIKIEISEPEETSTVARTWIGVCRGEVDLDEGLRRIGGAGTSYVRQGVRKYTVLGIESMLDNQIVLESAVQKPSGSGFWKIHRGLTFNDPHQRGKANKEATTGNRSGSTSTVRPGVLSYLFPSNLDDAKRWTSLNIAEYLLAHFSPASDDGQARIKFELLYNFSTALTWYETPVLPAEGRSVWSLLNQLFARQRGIAFRVQYEVSTDVVQLVLFTFNPSNITFSDDVLPANTEQSELLTDDGSDIEGLTISKENLGRVNQVVVRGARAITVGTIAGEDGTISNYWAAADATAYATAGEDEAGFAALDEDEKDLVRQEARAQERFAKVYRDYGLPIDWDGKLGNGEGGTPAPHFLDVYGDGTASTLNYWLPGLRFETQLPLRTNSDYKDGAIASGVVNTTQTNQPWEWRPILVCAKTSVQLLPPEIADDLGNSDFDYDGRWLNLIDWDKNPALEFSPNLYAVTPRPLQDAPGLALRVQGAPQFVLGSDVEQLLEYYGLARVDTAYLTATVAFEVDAWCEGKYPASVSGSAIIERQVINAGERAQLIYVCPGTVIDVKDGELVRSNGGYLRDDRERLNALAQFAYRWYNTPRNKISFTIHRTLLQEELVIGRLITRIGGGGGAGSSSYWRTVNTPITSLVYEFPEAAGERPPFPRTRLATDFASLDFESF